MNKIFIVRNEGKRSADIFLYGIVGDYWYSDSAVNARNLQYQMSLVSDFPIINIHLCGPGGDVHEGLLMVNIIKASKKEIHIWNDGICCSMMAIILMAAVKKERRHAAKASLTMFHKASTITWGNSGELREQADILDKHDDVLMDVICDATGMTMDEVKNKWFDGKDHWLTATEGAALGLFVIEEYDIQPIPENVQNQTLDKIAAFWAPKNGNQTNPAQLNNENMALISIGNKLPKLTALGKVAVNDRTAELLVEANQELESEGIPGITLVYDADLQETITKADKVDGLEQKVSDLDTSVKEKDQKILDLQKVIDEQAKKLGEPIVPATAPKTEKVDNTTGDLVTGKEELSVQDREVAEINRVTNLIP
ncbi:Clp protease ClpP [Pedobacter ginsengisoli]|uniref:Clp protease ClpP n=1 Tax=Pedobacter ginsengisoli TaxID=363852 RepID=UPI00254AC328|nr:Clp protease ClpP [Pedobacter ginsengisoli]